MAANAVPQVLKVSPEWYIGFRGFSYHPKLSVQLDLPDFFILANLSHVFSFKYTFLLQEVYAQALPSV